MKKAINLYFPIYSYTADYIITAMEEAEGDEFVMRINSPGGDVFAGWGIAAKMRELDAKVIAKVDGMAASMAALLCLFADEVHMSEVGRMMLHRADMQIRDEADQVFLDDVNVDIKNALKAKINNKAFKEITGYTVEKLFSAEERIDLWLNAKQAKAIGLVDKVVKLRPTQIAALSDYTPSIAAFGISTPPPLKTEDDNTDIHIDAVQTSTNKNNNSMTAEEFAQKHPEAHKAILKGAAAAERDRVNAWLKFVDVDAEAVKAGIESGDPIGQTAFADFMAKLATATATASLKAEGKNTAEATSKDEAPKGGEEKTEKTQVELFAEQVKGYLPSAEA